MTRPSIRDTDSASGVKTTPDTRSSAVSAKMPIPGLEELLLVLLNQGFYPTKLDRVKPEISGQRHGPEPELG